MNDQEIIRETNKRENIDELDVIGVTLLGFFRKLFNKIKQTFLSGKKELPR